MHSPAIARRPPHELSSTLLQISHGCTWGRCLYCRDSQLNEFSLVPMEHIVEDLDEIAATDRHPRRVLLLGGNPMGLPNDKLIPILKLIREKLPTVTEVSGYMRTADIKLKTDEELAEMAAWGVTEVTLGTECGWNPALERMHKGHTAEDIVTQYPRLEAAGIEYSIFYIGGYAGAGKCLESALESARVISQTNPKRITVMTLTPFEDTLLRNEVLDGKFELAPESEVMEDVATFIENLNCQGVLIRASHETDLFRVEGILPRDRERIVATLRFRAGQVDDAKAKGMRMSMREG